MNKKIHGLSDLKKSGEGQPFKPTNHIQNNQNNSSKLIAKIETLGLVDRDTDVRKLLCKACYHVQPIMKKRQWAVGLVKEFIPKSQNLLGLNENKGQVISIRVRRSDSNGNSLYHYEHILGTLLHELVHIEHGPHNGLFYKLLDELKAECEKIPEPTQLSNTDPNTWISGPGQKLSGFTHNPRSKQEVRMKALESAMRRQQINQLMSGGPRKLGGGTLNSHKKLSPREAVRLATERRFADENWCGCGAY